MCTGTHPFIPATGAAQAVLRYTCVGQQIENVLHFSKPTGGFSLEDCTTLADNLVDWWDNDFYNKMPENLLPVEFVVTAIDTEAGAQAVVSDFDHEAGSVAASAAPLNATLAIKLATGIRGRSTQGRCFVPAIPNTEFVADDNNQVTTVWRDAIVTAFESLISLTHDVGYDLSVVSYCHDGVWRDTALVTVVATVSADTFVDSQRRRLTGRGR